MEPLEKGRTENQRVREVIELLLCSGRLRNATALGVGGAGGMRRQVRQQEDADTWLVRCR